MAPVSAARAVPGAIAKAKTTAMDITTTHTFDATPDGTTAMRSVERYPSKDVLDGALASGMESGARETMDQLEAVAAALASSEGSDIHTRVLAGR